MASAVRYAPVNSILNIYAGTCLGVFLFVDNDSTYLMLNLACCFQGKQNEPQYPYYVCLSHIITLINIGKDNLNFVLYKISETDNVN